MIRLADNLQIDLQKAAGQRFAVIGKSGSGKTNTLAVFVEEWIGAGLPATILDPMAQFHHLPAHLPVILAGRGKSAHVEITGENAALLARLSVVHRVSVALDLSLYTEDESLDILRGYLESMWAVVFAQETPQPYALVIDEAHLYAPQSGVTVLSKTIIDIAKRGRHKNLTTVIATQRAAAITKEFLTQATLLVAHRLTFGVDTGILQEQLPLPKQELNAMMRKLATGEAVMIGDAALVGDVDYLRVQVRERQNPMVDAPVIAAVPAGQIVDVLRALAEMQVDEAPVRDEAGYLRDENRAFKSIIAEQDEKITSLRALVALMAAARPVQPEVSGIQTGIEVTISDEPYRSPLSIQRAKNQQRRKLDSLITVLRKTSASHRSLFTWLLEHDGQRLNLKNAARRLGYSTSTMIKHPPTKLIEMGLMQREWGADGDGYEYFVSQSVIAAQFPDLPIAELVSDLSGVV